MKELRVFLRILLKPACCFYLQVRRRAFLEANKVATGSLQNNTFLAALWNNVLSSSSHKGIDSDSIKCKPFPSRTPKIMSELHGNINRPYAGIMGLKLVSIVVFLQILSTNNKRQIAGNVVSNLVQHRFFAAKQPKKAGRKIS